MKKVTLLACLCCTLLSCENVEKKAGEKLQTARAAFERGDFSEAMFFSFADVLTLGFPITFVTYDIL